MVDQNDTGGGNKVNRPHACTVVVEFCEIICMQDNCEGFEIAHHRSSLAH
jgi:hypothetical protein